MDAAVNHSQYLPLIDDFYFDSLDSSTASEDSITTMDSMIEHQHLPLDEVFNFSFLDDFSSPLNILPDYGYAQEALFISEPSDVSELDTEAMPPASVGTIINLAGDSDSDDILMPETPQASERLPVNRPIKRRQRHTASPPRKKRKFGGVVNIRATRAYVQPDSKRGAWEYTWRRGRGGKQGSWSRDLGGGDREEVSGEYLLSFSSDALSVVIRANADWLPLTVRWNDQADVFEGFDSLDGTKLQVEPSVMIYVMCGEASQYLGLVS
ncbi:hypothetical protein GGR54DRAFT_646880 [Hypoxylon sp. NC1633]|nr:hypothetical protein GGR54DRAFT_646880 [Hypoxylon sp. NC1633]